MRLLKNWPSHKYSSRLSKTQIVKRLRKSHKKHDHDHYDDDDVDDDDDDDVDDDDEYDDDDDQGASESADSAALGSGSTLPYSHQSH